MEDVLNKLIELEKAVDNLPQTSLNWQIIAEIRMGIAQIKKALEDYNN